MSAATNETVTCEACGCRCEDAIQLAGFSIWFCDADCQADFERHSRRLDDDREVLS